jgi:hypothetical protein
MKDIRFRVLTPEFAREQNLRSSRRLKTEKTSAYNDGQTDLIFDIQYDSSIPRENRSISGCRLDRGTISGTEYGGDDIRIIGLQVHRGVHEPTLNFSTK